MKPKIPVSAKSFRSAQQDATGLNKETYRRIFAEVEEALRNHVAENPRSHKARVTVPSWMPSRPPYAHDHAVNYVAGKLKMRGFTVSRNDSDLVVDWAPKRKASVPNKIPPSSTSSSSFIVHNPTVAKAFRNVQDLRMRINNTLQ